MGKEADGRQCKYFEGGIKENKGPGYRAPWVRISRKGGEEEREEEGRRGKGEGRCMVGWS